jgi:hypothetical protein
MLPSNALRKEPLWWNVISVPFLVFRDWLPAQVAEGARWKFAPTTLLAAHGEGYCVAGSLDRRLLLFSAGAISGRSIRK